jgi:hypothetical protein
MKVVQYIILDQDKFNKIIIEKNNIKKLNGFYCALLDAVEKNKSQKPWQDYYQG